ncbi:MAG: endonuclease [Candidatus Diapherotrites archaeon]|nr:endonuclease [Candidatus Micrarchaeota archaeon]MBU1939927.1 endonuclease [Candidatus Micrarchaeota archaeon]
MQPHSIYTKMLSHFGAQNWWPVTGKGAAVPSYIARKKLTENQKFEIMTGAILTQNTAWNNVMRALENLNKEGLLDCTKITRTNKNKIAKLIRPSGYFNMKAEKLKRFAQWLDKNYKGKPSRFFNSGKPLGQLRSELLAQHGIGNETADSMLLYAGNLPSFVVDAYTMRFMSRFYGLSGHGYVEVKSFFERSLPQDAQIYNEMHALFVELGKNYCKKSNPKCGECCLRNGCKSAGAVL